MNAVKRPDLVWVVMLICAAGFLASLDAARIHRVDLVTNAVVTPAVTDPKSPTGYSGGLRQLIVPEHNNDCYQWIVQTQQILAGGEWRLRQVSYDNAPTGREVRSPSPYRWWLVLVASIDHLFSGQSLALAVERSALYADASLHLFLLVSVALFCARYLGAAASALVSLAVVAVFPLAGAFLPGQPDDSGLSVVAAVWSVLPLLVMCGSCPASLARSGPVEDPDRRAVCWFALAGVAGGLGLWVNPARELMILGGIALGGLLAAVVTRPDDAAVGLGTVGKNAWRVWALSGAATTLGVYFLEFFPANLGGFRMDAVHPLDGVAWLGAGELLSWSWTRLRGGKPAWKFRDLGILVPAALGVGSLVWAVVLTGGAEFLQADSNPTRLTNLPDSPVAASLWTWIQREAISGMAVATLIPVLLLVPAIWAVARRKTAANVRGGILIVAGPALVALAVACSQLRWWNLFDALLLPLLAAVTVAVGGASQKSFPRWLWAAVVVLGLSPGLKFILGEFSSAYRSTMTEGEVIALVERDLAHWIASHAGEKRAMVLAPPSLTVSLIFHGGLTGLGTPFRENKDGFAAALRIAGATSPDEAQAVARHRELTQVVMPSWDPFLDEYARLGAAQADHSLVASLHRWLPPRWLRPLPYRLPAIPGFEGQSVVIFEVVPVQDNVTAMSNLAEYFAEMGQLDQAAAAERALKRLFPGELGAVAARARAANACGDTEGFATALGEIQTFVSRGGDHTLAWDRRVSVAIALAEGRKFEAARDVARSCVAEIDETRIRSLTTDSLYRLLVLCKAFGLALPNEKLREVAGGLLPDEMRPALQ